MPDLDILRDLLADEALVSASDDQYGNRTLVLEDPEAAYAMTIRAVPDDVLAIRADAFPAPMFRGGRGERKRADFVVVASTARKAWLVYIELKGGKKRASEIRQQLMGAKCLLAYCRSVGQVFWQQAGFLDESRYCQRFVSITCISMNKKPTRQRRRPARVHDTPENMLRINAPGKRVLQFGTLVGGEADAG